VEITFAAVRVDSCEKMPLMAPNRLFGAGQAGRKCARSGMAGVTVGP